MGRWRLLIVEDEALLARAMSDVLAEAHDVEHVATVAAARRRFEQLPTLGGFDVVLCDVQLPDGTASEVREAYRAAAGAGASDHRFVLITGGDESYARRLGGGGASPVLRKPFDLDELPFLLAQLVS